MDFTVGTQTLLRQREILASLQRRVRRLLGKAPASLRAYRKEYERSFLEFEAHSSKSELIAEAKTCDIVFCGDYHTLLQAQKTTVKILREIVPHRPIVLALEMVRARDQRHVDSFLQAEIGEEEFLANIGYEDHWGFPWAHYRIFFDFAKAHDLPVVALDMRPPAKDPNRLLKRDAFAAQILAKSLEERPESLHWVVYGDLHVAPAHLPKQLQNILKEKRTVKKQLLIFQNNKHLYFRLAEEKNQLHIDTVRLQKGMYCILNTPPWIKLRTYLDHLETKVFLLDDEEDEIDSEGSEENPEYEDFVYQLIQEIATLIGVEGYDFADFKLYSPRHVREVQDSLFVPGPAGTLEALLETAQAFYFPRDRVMLLASFDANHAAEAAGEFVHHLCSGYSLQGQSPRDLFYLSAVVKTFGFFASLLMNPKRKTDYFKDHDMFLHRWRRKPLRGPRAIQRRVSGFVVAHQRAMEEVMKRGSGQPRLRAIYREDPVLGFRVSRALGTIMGDKLFRAVLGGQIDRESVLSMMHQSLQRPGEAYQLYLQLRIQLKSVKKPYKSKDEFF